MFKAVSFQGYWVHFELFGHYDEQNTHMVVPQPLRIPCQDAKRQQQTCQHGTRLMAGELGPWPRSQFCQTPRFPFPVITVGDQPMIEMLPSFSPKDPKETNIALRAVTCVLFQIQWDTNRKYHHAMPLSQQLFVCHLHPVDPEKSRKIVKPRPAEGPHPLQSIAGSARRWSQSSKPSTAIVDPQCQGFPVKKSDDVDTWHSLNPTIESLYPSWPLFQTNFSPHHCVGFLFFAWIPPLSSAAVRRRAALTTHSLTHSPTHPPTHSLTHSLTHWLTHSLHTYSPHTHSLTHCHSLTVTHSLSLTHSPTHSLTVTHSLSLTHCHSLTVTHSLSLTHCHSLTHSLTHSLSLTHSPTHSLTHAVHRASTLRFCVAGAVHRASRRSLAGAIHRSSSRSCGARGRRWPAAAFCVAGAVQRASSRSCGARGRCWPAAAFCVAGAIHRASTRSCGARGRRWPAAAFCVAGAVHRARGCLLRGRRSTQSLLEELRRAWPPLARGCLLRGRRSTQSLLAELRRAWPPLARGCLLRGRRSTQSLLAELRRAWLPLARGCLLRGRCSTQSLLAELRSAWPPLARGCLLRGRCSTQSLLAELRRAWPPLARGCLLRGRRCGARGRRWPAAVFCVAGAVHRASWRSCGAVAAAGPRPPSAWQAQYTEPPHFPFAWQAQYTALQGGAAARVAAAGPRVPFAWQALRRAWPPLARGCLLRGRRSTQSFLAELRRGGRRWPAAAFCLASAVHRASALPFCVAGAVHSTSRRRRDGRRWPAAAFCLAASRTQTQSLAWQAQYTELHCSSQILTAPLLTGPLLITTHHSFLTPHFSQLPYHITTSHHTLSQLIPSQLHFSRPFSHPTYHIRTHHSSTSHTWHHKSTSHTSLLTSPKFTLKSYIHKGLACGVIRSFYFWTRMRQHRHVCVCRCRISPFLTPNFPSVKKIVHLKALRTKQGFPVEVDLIAPSNPQRRTCFSW